MLRSALRRICLRTVGLGLLLGPVSILAQESDPLRFGLGDAPFSLRADEISYDPERGVYEAVGHVHIEQPDGDTLTADWVVFNAVTNIGAASGNVVLRSGSDTIRAEFAAVDLDAFTALATEAVLDTAEPGFVVEGQPLQKTGTNTYHVEEAVFTTCRCPPGAGCRPWTIEAAEADIRVGGYAVARDVTFHILDVPVLYTPWFLFPVKTERQSGFLIPRFFGDRRGGSVLEMPFFWAVRDELNVLLRPGWYSKRGIKTGVELEYVVGEEGEGEAGATILPNDDEIRDDDPDTQFSADRWAFWLRHRQPLGRVGRIGLDVKQVSDNLYVLDFQDLPHESRTARFLESSAWVSLGGGALRALAELALVDDLQSPNHLDRDDFMLHRLPDLRVASLPRRIGRLPIFGALDSRYTYFYQRANKRLQSGLPAINGQFFDTGPDGLFDAEEPTAEGLFNGADNHADGTFSTGPPVATQEGDRIFQEGELLADSGHRLDLYPRLSLPFQVGIIEVLSELGFRETLYQAKRAGSERREIWTGRLDVRSRFERIFETGSSRLRHLLEPRVAFVLVSTPGQAENPLFIPEGSVRQRRLLDADPRLRVRNPSDRIADEQVVQLALGSRLFRREFGADGAVHLLAEARLSSSYDLLRSRLVDVFLVGQLWPSEDLAFAYELGWDPEEARLNEALASIGWHAESGHELAASYRLLRDINTGFEAFNISDDVFEEFEGDFDRVSQLTLSGRWVISRRWELFGDGFVSLEESSTGAGGVGVVFRSACDCWGVVAQVRRTDRPAETRFDLQFQLSGLGRTLGGDFGREYTRRGDSGARDGRP